MKLTRRHLLAGALLSGCASRAGKLGCESLAGQNIRWIVPFAAGGGNDYYSRLIARAMGKVLGADIAVANEPGAGSRVGLTKLRAAAPDGRTLGSINGPGSLAASIVADADYPVPTRDFTILGRLVPTHAAMATGVSSGIRTLDDLFELQKRRPILAGITGVSSSNFLNITVLAWLLGLRIEYVAGFNGSAEIQLAAQRGEVDVITNAHENLEAGFRQGDVRLLLQVSDGPLMNDPQYRNAPMLGGPEGLAAKRAAVTGRSAEEAMRDARILIAAGDAGTVMAAPPAMPAELVSCLRATFDTAAQDAEMHSTAQRTGRQLQPISADATRKILEEAEQGLTRFEPVIREAARRVVG